jgi:hypothetical protein
LSLRRRSAGTTGCDSDRPPGTQEVPRHDHAHRQVGRRTDVVSIFPDDRSLIRLAGMLCIEQNDEWLVGRGYLSDESISLVLAGLDDHTDNEIKEKVAQLQAA